ncbi:hypothetical protein [Tropicimonas sp. IMCC6043]|uniref:hypothetical protein n=1 Tax=Tropicimonas sp. IMCC6043 TaxID=2510645 RepID=UPI0013EB1774|nr:hypothetical protein [Tropicimonas sp. IMCC6043]
MTLATRTSVNDLKSIIQGTQEAKRANPEMGKVTFKSACKSMEGFRTEAAIRNHKLMADFSEALGGIAPAQAQWNLSWLPSGRARQ